MEVTGRCTNAEQFGAGGRQFHEHRLHKVLRLGALPCERAGVAEQGRSVGVVQLPEGVRPARREVAEQLPVSVVVAGVGHSEGKDEQVRRFCHPTGRGLRRIGSMRSITRQALMGLLVMAAGAWAMQERHPVSGRVIAQTMSVLGAPWLDRPEREAEEQPTRAVEALRLRPGMVVADVGAGSGYYTVRLSRAVGRDGRVVATDVQPGMLDLIRTKLTREKFTNVSLVQCTMDDPRLPAETFDMILMVDVYHELSGPQAFVRKLRSALKPEGRLVLIEFRGEDPAVPIQALHKMTVAQVRQELAADGFTIERVIDVLPWQHIIVLKQAASK